LYGSLMSRALPHVPQERSTQLLDSATPDFQCPTIA
jgi:hypothetical protein